jgi:hypothetical protein
LDLGLALLALLGIGVAHVGTRASTLARSERGDLRLRGWQTIVSNDDKECLVCGEASLTRLARKMKRLAKVAIRVELGQEDYPLAGRRGKRQRTLQGFWWSDLDQVSQFSRSSIFILLVNGSRADWANISWGCASGALSRDETKSRTNRFRGQLFLPPFPSKGSMSCFIRSTTSSTHFSSCASGDRDLVMVIEAMARSWRLLFLGFLSSIPWLAKLCLMAYLRLLHAEGPRYIRWQMSSS